MASNYEYSTDDASYIGCGAFGQVFKGIDKSTNDAIAVKKVPKRANNEDYMRILLREVNIMKDISHPNLVKLFDHEDTEKFTCFILEYCDAGDLEEHLRKLGTMTVDQKIEMMAQCSSGVRYMHEKNIVHRDLKPTNLLVKNENGEPVVKVADFGLARHAPSDGSFSATMCGTPNYSAPESLPNEEQNVRYSIAVDVFALGVIYLALAEHKAGERLAPMKVNNKPLGSWMREGKALCVEAPIKFDVKSNQYVNKVKIIVSQMLKMLASDRMTIQQVCDAIKHIQDEKRENRRVLDANSRIRAANKALRDLLRDIGSAYDSVDDQVAVIRQRLGIAEG